MEKEILLIDGHSMINRAFYGVPPLTNSKGFHTNAIYGFFNIMFSVLDDINPGYLMVAFDLKAPTFRHKLFSDYKGTRKPMPEELREQVPVVQDLLKAMNIPIMTCEGYEADDILGTMSKRAEMEGFNVTILSGDRDLLQLASDNIRIRLPHTKGGKTEVEDFYAAQVMEKYQVSPLGIIELKALMGDKSDNIPGVDKIGEKTATDLVKTYGNIENLKLHRDEITKKSIRETLMENFHMAELSKVLATIDINADIPFKLQDGRLEDIYTKEAFEMFSKLECKNLLSRFNTSSVSTDHKEAEYFQYISDLAKAEEIFSKIKNSKEVSLYLYDEKNQILGMSVALSQEDIYFIEVSGFISSQYLADKYIDFLVNTDIRIYTFGLKNQLHILSQTLEYNDNLASKLNFRQGLIDLKLVSYLCNPVKSEYSIEDIAINSLGLTILSKKQLFDKKDLTSVREDNKEEFLKFVCYRAYVCLLGASSCLEELEKKGMTELFINIEMPLIFTLFKMEKTGVKVKPEALKAYGENLVERISELEKSIHKKAGVEFNINSPKQLGEILFEKLGLPGGKKTKTGYSTAADVLEKLAVDNPIVSDILEYRTLSKLKSTYADGLSVYIDETDRIHTTFHQTITATGRLSSADPNLQNIPVRTEIGRALRKIFVPENGCVFVDADYSQIELRLLACMSEDEKLIAAYNQDQDIHKITASQVFNIPLQEVTPEIRRNAKAVNFGIVYGISSFGLSQDLSITKKEAASYIDNYFVTYPGVKKFLDELVKSAKDNGYVKTMFNRVRPVPELSSGNFMQRQFGERVAMNAPVQGTAADIMKIAMLGVEKRLIQEGLKAKIVLQVHDELLLETPVEEKEKVCDLLREEMMNAAKLPVPLEAEVECGNDWYEAH